MKYILFSVLLAYSFVSLSQQKVDIYSHDDDEVKGKVIKMIQYTYNASGTLDSLKKKKLYLMDSLNFNSQGKLVSKYTFDAKGKMRDKNLYKYDSKNRVIELKCISVPVITPLDFIQRHVYDSIGNLTITYMYDGLERLISKDVFTSDSIGNRIRKTDFEKKSTKPYSVEEYTYSFKCDTMWSTKKYFPPSYSEDAVTTYDSLGRIIGNILYGPNSRYVYEFDTNGFCKYFACYELSGKLIWEFNSIYPKLDKMNNWVMKIELEGYKAKAIYERRFTYAK